jgi:hypothetical protein
VSEFRSGGAVPPPDVVESMIAQIPVHPLPSHPYTCPHRDDGRHNSYGGDEGILLATATCLWCPTCNYQQALPLRSGGLSEQ